MFYDYEKALGHTPTEFDRGANPLTPLRHSLDTGFGASPFREPETIAARNAAAKAFEAEQQKREAAERRFWIDHQSELLQLGKNMPEESGRRIFTNAGCIASLLAIIEDGKKKRAEIMLSMRCDYRYTYRHAGFLLTRLTGKNRSKHLWFKDENRLYKLLTLNRQLKHATDGFDNLWSSPFK